MRYPPVRRAGAFSNSTGSWPYCCNQYASVGPATPIPLIATFMTLPPSMPGCVAARDREARTRTYCRYRRRSDTMAFSSFELKRYRVNCLQATAFPVLNSLSFYRRSVRTHHWPAAGVRQLLRTPTVERRRTSSATTRGHALPYDGDAIDAASSGRADRHVLETFTTVRIEPFDPVRDERDRRAYLRRTRARRCGARRSGGRRARTRHGGETGCRPGRSRWRSRRAAGGRARSFRDRQDPGPRLRRLPSAPRPPGRSRPARGGPDRPCRRARRRLPGASPPPV